ncbi:MAG TPA: LCP family protein [Candidatus Limnocylindrales bacterium]|nr:LCP family protein [Candidatus Limnocylindrales bacterium]
MTSTSSNPEQRSACAFLLAAAVLLVAILVALVLLATPLLRFTSERSAYEAEAGSFPLTATAIGPAVQPSAPKLHRQIKPEAPQPEQIIFATNTPVPVPAALPTVAGALTATPAAPGAEPLVQVTPPPLPTLFIYSGPDQSGAAPTAIPTAVQPLDRHGDDLMNILLIGNDGEITNDGSLRTDTMILVSVNRTAGTVSLLSIPRDLYVYIPSWTMQRINTTWAYGDAVGWTDGGFGLMRQTILYNLGINVHHYAMVDLTGFKALVDAVGGVELAVDCAIQDLPLVDSQVPAAAYPASDPDYWVLPVGSYTMNGAEALWYARSRHNSSDFDRGRRQLQLLRAVWRKARAQGLLTQIPELWTQASPYVQTSLTLEDILSLAPIAANLDPGKIEEFTLVRTYHTTPWQTPDGDYVQLPQYETMRLLLEDFYSPPTQNQITFEGAAVGVYNGTGNANWDVVAAQRLQSDGFNAFALGPAPGTDHASTLLVDHTGSAKGSSLAALARSLNLNADQISVEPAADRAYDFEVIIGLNYNSCSQGGVLPVDPPPTPSSP